MVHLSSMMVAVTAMVLGINALDDNSANRLRDELKAANIIPDAFENVNPLTEMKVIYNDKEVKNGDKILPSEAADRPGIQFTAPDKNKQYTVVMEDLDTPAPHVRHWIATNIKGADAENVVKDPTKMQDYVPYKGPTPPDNGFHRYVFALYEQSQENQKMMPELEDPTNHRAFFDVNKFAEENKLKLVAASYMNSEHQEGYESHYSKTDKRSLARRAISKKKGYTPNGRLVRRDTFDGMDIQNISPGEQAVYYGGDGYIPSAGITGQYGGTWNNGQSFSSGYGQPSNGGQGGYDSGAGVIVAGNGPPGSIPGNYDPTTDNWYYTGGNTPSGSGKSYTNGNPPSGSGNWYYNGVNTGGNVPYGNWYFGNGGIPGGNLPSGSGTRGVSSNWYINGNGGYPGSANGYYNGGGETVFGGSGSLNGNIGGVRPTNPDFGNGGIAVGGSGSINGNTGGVRPANPGNGGIVVGSRGSGPIHVGTGTGTGSNTSNGNGGIVIHGGGGATVDTKPTPATPDTHTSYYTYYYTIDGVDYQPGHTYRGNDGQLYRIPFPTATPSPNLHRRDEIEEEEREDQEKEEQEQDVKEGASMSVIEFDEDSGLNEDDIKLYNGIQDAIRAMDEAADDLNDLVADIYLGEEVASAN